MGIHVLDTPLDHPAADYFLNEYGVASRTEAEYSRSYQDRRIHAAHLPARYECNRFAEADGSPHYWEYRESAWDEPGMFRESLDRAAHMISSSYGWAPNRAAKIYAEAYQTNDFVTSARAGGLDPKPGARA